MCCNINSFTGAKYTKQKIPYKIPEYCTHGTKEARANKLHVVPQEQLNSFSSILIITSTLFSIFVRLYDYGIAKEMIVQHRRLGNATYTLYRVFRTKNIRNFKIKLKYKHFNIFNKLNTLFK